MTTYHQNSLGQTTSTVRLGVLGALLLSALNNASAQTEEISHPRPQVGIYAASITSSTNNQLLDHVGIANSVPAPSLELQVSALYSQVLTNEKPLDQESVGLYFDNLWDLYVE